MVVRPGGLPPSNLTTCPRTVKEVEAVRAGGNCHISPISPPYSISLHTRELTLLLLPSSTTTPNIYLRFPLPHITLRSYILPSPPLPSPPNYPFPPLTLPTLASPPYIYYPPPKTLAPYILPSHPLPYILSTLLTPLPPPHIYQPPTGPWPHLYYQPISTLPSLL